MKTLLATLLLIASTVHLSAQNDKLTFDPPRGFYETAMDVIITSPDEGSMIKYTLNGENPLTSKKALSAPSPATVRIDPNSTTNRDKAPGVCVRAIAVIEGQPVTTIATHTYLFPTLINPLSPDNGRPGSKWPAPGTSVNGQEINYGMDPDVYNNARYRDKIVPAMLAVPSFSMVIDLDSLFNAASGIYVNAAQHGDEWERTCSLELLNPVGSDGFHINCGVRIRGGWSRVTSNPKHAFRFFFSKKYGEATLKYPLFENEGVDEFHDFDLACPQNYSWSYGADDPHQNTFLRDQFSRDLQRDMGETYTRSRYYHLYINGTYWGLFYTQERSEASFAASYLGGNANDYDVIKVDAGYGRSYLLEATDGVLDAYYSLWTIANQGFESDDNYYRVQGLNSDGSPNPAFPKWVDLDNLIDYMINTYYVGDFDAPISNFSGNLSPNNFYAICSRISPRGFIYLRHDAEHIMNVAYGVNIDRTGPYPAGDTQERFNPQWLHQQLCTHPEYRLRFADRVYKHFFNGGALTEQANTERVQFRQRQLDPAIVAESARWGDSKRGTPYTRDDDWLPAVNWILDSWIPFRNDIALGQFINKGWYPAFAPPVFNTRDATVDKGFQLAMTSAAGRIYYTMDGIDPHNAHTRGGMLLMPLVTASAAKRAIVPASAVSLDWRAAVSFDDSDWDLCTGVPGGIGYEKSTGYESYISLDVAKYMYQDDTTTPNSSCLVRIPFAVNGADLAKISALKLSMRYDDGFIAWLNNSKVAEMYAPTDPQWNSMATDSHESTQVESFDISQYIGQLHAGQNLLAIQGFNNSYTSSDFLILVELQGGIVEAGGELTSPTAMEYKAPVAINKTTRIKARVLNNGQWSAEDEITLAVQEDFSALKITEIHYNPLPLIEGTTKIDGDMFEFLELKNIGGTPLNLTGAAFIKGVKYEFPPQSSLAPAQFYVLCSSAPQFKQRYGFDADGQYTGNLSNAGERVVLAAATGDTIVSVKYNDKAPWPWEPDSTGQSLVSKLAKPTGDPDDPAYWTISSEINGSPKADDPASPVKKDAEIPPVVFRLHPNYPNPFNPQTTLRFDIPKEARVTLTIYNALGQLVTTLIDQRLQAGQHAVTWDAASYAGGVYLARLHAEGVTRTVKLLLMK
jgi:hypothetical protein